MAPGCPACARSMSPERGWALLMGVAAVAMVTVLGASASPPPEECFHRLRTQKGLNGSSCLLYPWDAVPGEKPGAVGPEKHEHRSDGIDVVTNVTRPTLLAFLVPGSDAAVVIAPGGGYDHLNFNGEGTDVAAWANSVGLSAFLLKYRVPARSWLGFGVAPLMDAQRAMHLLRHRAGDLGLDPARLGFVGFSAGGHLTAQISTNYSNLAYPPLDVADASPARPAFALLVYPWRLIDTQGAVQLTVGPDTPPSFLAAAEDDPSAPVENSLLYFLRLKENGVSLSALHVFPKGGHGFGVCLHPKPEVFEEACAWPGMAASFLATLYASMPVPPGPSAAGSDIEGVLV